MRRTSLISAEQIRELRTGLELSQENFARFLSVIGQGVIGQTVSSWETGEKSPQPGMQRLLLRLYQEWQRNPERLKRQVLKAALGQLRTINLTDFLSENPPEDHQENAEETELQPEAHAAAPAEAR